MGLATRCDAGQRYAFGDDLRRIRQDRDGTNAAIGGSHDDQHDRATRPARLHAAFNVTTTKPSAPPFTLPAEPVDRYEVTYYPVELQGRYTHVREMRAVFIACATYAEVFPERDAGNGKPFNQEWLLYENGRSVARSAPGWMSLIMRTADCGVWAGSFATRDGANAYAVAHIKEALVHMRADIADAEQRILAYGGEL